VMQALSYRPSTTITIAKKLIPRKPNENQKRTKYSKSNLAWLYKNKPECEVLENNKRFMKDLHRYFRDVNELIDAI